MHAYRNWILASRPWSFAMTAISVSVGSAMAAMDGGFHWGYFLLALAAAVILHAATNLANDYYDVTRGVDTLAAATAQYRPHPIVEGLLAPEKVLGVVLILYLVSSGIGVFLAAARGWPILWIGLIGVAASFTYTGPPLNYKYRALGEFSVFLMWGPLMVEGAYYVQRQAFSRAALWVSIPFGVLVALVLLSNNIRDIAHDSRKGIRTLPILIGRRNGLRLFMGLIALSYASILWMSLRGPLGPWSLIVLISLPLAFRLLRQMHRRIPDDADAQTAKLDTAFGVFLVASLVLEGLL